MVRATENKWCAVYAQDECVAPRLPLRSQGSGSRSVYLQKDSAILVMVLVKKNWLAIASSVELECFSVLEDGSVVAM